MISKKRHRQTSLYERIPFRIRFKSTFRNSAWRMYGHPRTSALFLLDTGKLFSRIKKLSYVRENTHKFSKTMYPLSNDIKDRIEDSVTMQYTFNINIFNIYLY